MFIKYNTNTKLLLRIKDNGGRKGKKCNRKFEKWILGCEKISSPNPNLKEIYLSFF